MRPRSGWLVGGAVVAGVVIALSLVVRFGPALGLSLALGLSGDDAWLIPFGRDPAREAIILVADGRELDAISTARPGRAARSSLSTACRPSGGVSRTSPGSPACSPGKD